MTISLCILAKNEAHCIAKAINSTKHLVNEVIVIDDHSTDNTANIASSLGALVVPLPWHTSETGFAKSANYMISRAKHEWVFILDADEELKEQNLHQLLRYPDKEAWALPRRKWLDQSTREEYEAYPDWQIRLFKNRDTNFFIGEMHVRFCGCTVHKAWRGPHIEHYQSPNRTPDKLSQRDELYQTLAAKQNVAIVGGHQLETE